MYPPLGAAVLSALVFVATERIPALDLERYCDAIVTRVAPIADKQVCIQKEKTAREQLHREWAQFHPDDKSGCLHLSTAAGSSATYTALLSCLELQREARSLRQKNDRGTTRLDQR